MVTGGVGLRRIAGVVAALLIAGGAAANLLAARPYLGLPLLAAAPLVAGAMLSFRLSVACALLVCALSVAIDTYRARAPIALSVDLADLMLTGVLAVGINRVLSWQRHHLARARDVAEAAQRAVLPEPASVLGRWRVAARYEVAEAEARIGGDLFAVQSTPFGVRAIIADVRGKGLQAVAYVSVVVGAFRQEAEHTEVLGELARRLDGAVSRENNRRGDPTQVEDFVTAALVELPDQGGSVRLISLGHPAPCLFSAGNVSRLEPPVPELPLGMRGLTADGGVPPAVHTFPLPPAASLVLVTDGVTEARDQHGAFYDPGVGLSAQEFTDPDALADALVQDVVAWTGGTRQDDMALLVLTNGASNPGDPNPGGPNPGGPNPGDADPSDTAGGGTGHTSTPHVSAGD